MEDELLRAKKKAMALLMHNDRTEYELRSRLKRAGYSESAEDAALEYVMSFGYVNDTRYASRYVEFYQEKKSKKQLELDLQKRGVKQEDIAQAFDDEWEGEDAALQLALKKRLGEDMDVSGLGYQEKQKIAAALYRKGFARGGICKALEL